MVRQGQQAIFICNGLFTSNRTLEQIFEQELAFLPEPIGDPRGGDYEVDYNRKGVVVGSGRHAPKMRAAFREGIGCVILPPDQTLANTDQLPLLDLPYPDDDPANTPWPQGDLVTSTTLPSYIDASALEAASDWAFDRESPEQVTLSLLILHRGNIIHERYAPGFNMGTRTRTWSTAKSIASTLIGMLVDQGKLSLDEPLGFPFLPESAGGDDPRAEITLRHVLNMSSGLEAVDNRGLEYAIGSGLSYWAGASSSVGARSRALIREPGTNWDYENYDTLLAIYAMKQALSEDEYREFPRTALLDKIGMQNTLVSTDRFGDFVLSSQVYTNARDLGRFGLLYLQNGVWNDERLVSREWIDFVRTPAPATSARGNFYGGQFWLVPDDRDDVPRDAYSTSGNRGQYTIMVPSHDLVIVRRGLDYGRQGFDRWTLVREILKALDAISVE
jgi:CubicO group peptidase (beta-lactamase class C family)